MLALEHDRHLGPPAQAPLAAPDPPGLARRGARPAPGASPAGPSAATSSACASSAIRSMRRPGPAGGYRLHAGTAMPPLLLDDDEAVAIAVGLRTAAGASVTGIEETSVRALVKLEQVLPSHLRRRVNALQTATVTPAASGPTIDPETLTAIAGASRDRERLRFDYRGRDATESRRLRRAAHPRQPRPALVPRGVGLRPRGLAHLPRRPPRAPVAGGHALLAPRAAQPRRRRLRGGQPVGRSVALPGARHPARLGTATWPSARSSRARRSRRSTSAPASCAPATTRSTGWPCAWRSSASTSRSTSRPSSWSAFASWPPDSSARRASWVAGRAPATSRWPFPRRSPRAPSPSGSTRCQPCGARDASRDGA